MWMLLVGVKTYKIVGVSKSVDPCVWGQNRSTWAGNFQDRYITSYKHALKSQKLWNGRFWRALKYWQVLGCSVYISWHFLMWQHISQVGIGPDHTTSKKPTYYRNIQSWLILNMLKLILGSKQRRRFWENFVWKKVSGGKDNIPEEKGMFGNFGKVATNSENGL